MEEEEQIEAPKKRGRPPKKRPTTTWVVCVKYPGEWEKLTQMVQDQAQEAGEDWRPVQELPLARLMDDCEVRAAFYVGDARHDTRRPHITPPVQVSNHWTPSRDGFGGELRKNTFLEELGVLCIPNNEGGVSIRSREDVLKVSYG